MIVFKMVRIMDEIISYKMCAVKVRNAKLRNYLKRDTAIYFFIISFGRTFKIIC
jgi:hypothetical protein